jgi:hypothetical protein
MKKIEEILRERNLAKSFVEQNIEIGIEFSSDCGDKFGVLLKEMYGSCPYRIQWYDREGISGHSEVPSLKLAIDILVSDLGYGIRLAPGSMDRLMKGWI